MIQLEKDCVYHLQTSTLNMACEYGVKFQYFGLKGSCVRDSFDQTFSSLIKIEIKQLISEAWSEEAMFRARSYLFSRDFKSALACLNEAVKLSRKSFQAILERAKALVYLGHFLTALKDLNFISENEPGCGEFQTLRQSVISSLSPNYKYKYGKNIAKDKNYSLRDLFKRKSTLEDQINDSLLSSRKLNCGKNKTRCFTYGVIKSFSVIFTKKKAIRITTTILSVPWDKSSKILKFRRKNNNNKYRLRVK